MKKRKYPTLAEQRTLRKCQHNNGKSGEEMPIFG